MKTEQDKTTPQQQSTMKIEPQKEHQWLQKLVGEWTSECDCNMGLPLDDMFWGDRYGKLEDPFGHHWSVATQIRDVSPEEMQQAAQKGCG